MSYGELVKAATLLQEAEQAAFCAAKPVEPRTLARLFYLRGVIAVQSHELELARGAFARALSIAPDLPWDDNYPTEGGLELFSAEKTARATVSATLTVVPRLPRGSSYVDGRPLDDATVRLAEGNHLIQLDHPVMSGWVTLPADTASTLVIPKAMPTATPVLDGPEAEVWTTALAASVGHGTPVHVVEPERVWTGNAGLSMWRAVDIPLPVVPDAAVVAVEPKKRLGHNLFVSGALTTIGGGLGLGTTFLLGRYEQDRADDATNSVELDGYRDRYALWRDVNRVSGGLMVVGGVVTVAGIVW